MYSSIKSCVKIDESSITELFSCNKGIRQGDSLSPVLFSLFMNDLPQYFRDRHCPGVMLGRHSLNCLMYADDLLVLSPLQKDCRNQLTLLKSTQYECEIWGPELLTYKTHFDKSTIEQVHIKFCKQTLNTPWYTENIACRAELGRYPLSIDLKASTFSYWLRSA